MLEKIFVKESIGKEVLLNSITTFIIKTFSILLSYFFIFYISRNFGAKTVGIINVANSLMTLASVLATLGFEQSILRFAGEHCKDRLAFFYIYRKMFSWILFSGFVVSSIIFFSKTFLSEILFRDFYNPMIFNLVALGVVFLALNSLNVEAIRGMLFIKESEIFRMFLINFVNVALFFIILLFIEFNIILPILTNFIGLFITFLISTYFIMSKVNKSKLNLNDKNNINTKQLFLVSLPMFYVSVASLVSSYTPVFTLAYFTDTKSVGVFNIAYKIATITSFFLVSINSIVAPKIAEFYWNRKMEDLNKTALLSAKLNFWSSAPLLALFIIIPKFFMGLFGKEFVEGYRSLIIISLGQFVNAFCGSVGYLLTMTGNQIVFRNIYLLATLINFILCLILVPLLGIDGASLGFAISMVFWNLVSLFYVKRKFGIVTYYVPFFKR
ncbi:MAG: flippase [Proteobacteria bacterium]|nr:flippase [Pseudomonadota bacterium]